MARYYGDFRSIDTSNDSEGQKYRVVIFTQYSGGNPYPYYTLYFPTIGGVTEIVKYPNKGVSLAMAETPFLMNMEGDDKNIYKPYRCSTASVNFLQSSINLDFLNTNGTSTLVFLLKWKNEVSEVNGAMMNTITGETLQKKRVSQLIDDVERVYFDDYEPFKYDNFCYSVEWCGFTTPETFSMDYTHTSDVFTLNCQDALSTLQYVKCDLNSATNELVNVKDVLLDWMASMGVYKHIYITDAIRFAGETESVIDHIKTQSKNYFDEDKKADSKFDVISNILTYLNLTAIPWKDRLYIVNVDAMAEQIGNYIHFELPESGYIFNWDGEYTQSTDVYINDVYYITKDSYFSGNTKISTLDVYSSSKCEVNEFPVGCIVPEVGDDNNFDSSSLYLQSYLNAWNKQWSWERKIRFPKQGTFTLYQYPTDGYYKHGLYHDDIWASDASALDVAAWTFNSATNHHPSCYIIDDGGVLDTSNNQLPMNVSYSRRIFFDTMGKTIEVSSRGTSSGCQNFDDKNTFNQPMLEVTSDNLLLNSGKWLNICGTFTYFLNIKYPNPSNHDSVYHSDNVDTYKANMGYAFQWAKVRCANKWLTSDSSGNYSWSDDESFVKLWLDCSTADSAFGTSFAFRQNQRNVEGIMIPLPFSSLTEGDIYVQFNRPLGVSSIICHSATLDDFGVYIRESNNPDDWSDSNTEWKTTIADAVNEADDVNIKCGSLQKQGVTYSQMAYTDASNNLAVIPCLYNQATTNLLYPESHITTSIASQSDSPRIKLDMILKNEITPITLIKWSQLSGRNFIVDSAEIDYESESNSIKLIEVGDSSVYPSQWRNNTRNYKRNGDLTISSARPINQINVINTDTSTSATFSTSNGQLIATATSDDIARNIAILPNFVENDLMVSVPSNASITFDVSGAEIIVNY